MAELRKGHSYTNVKRAYTRKSKFKAKGYIKAIPTSKVVRYDMGNQKKQFTHTLDLVSKQPIQVRHNALESCRLMVNRHLALGLNNNYFFKVRVYPHHVLRENKMITGAGADRMQKGMQKAFGKAIGLSAQVKKKQPVFSVLTNKKNIDLAKSALNKAKPRMPGQFSIELKEIN